MVVLLDLPPKALTKIIVALPPPDIVCLKRVNSFLKTFIKDTDEIAYIFNLKTAGLIDNPSCALSVNERRKYRTLKENNWNIGKICFELDFPVFRGTLANGVCAMTAREVFVGTYKIDKREEDKAEVDAEVSTSGVQHIALPTLVHQYEANEDWTFIGLDQPIVGFAESVDGNDLFALAAYEPDEENEYLYTIAIALVRASINRPHDEAKTSILTVGRLPKDYGPPRVGLAIAGENLAITIMARPEGQSDRDSLAIWDWKKGVQKHAQPFRPTDLAMTFLREDILVVCNSIRGSLDFYQIPLSSEIDLNPPEPAESTSSDPLQTTPLYLPPVRVRVISGFALPELNPGWTLSSIGCSSSPAPTPGFKFPKALEKMGEQPFTVDPKEAVVVFVIDAVREDDPEDRHIFHMVVHRQALLDLLPRDKFAELEEVIGRLKERNRKRGDVVDAMAAVGLAEEEDYQTNPYYGVVGWLTWGMDVTRWFDMDGFADAIGTVVAGQKYVQFELEDADHEDEEGEGGDVEKDGNDDGEDREDGDDEAGEEDEGDADEDDEAEEEEAQDGDEDDAEEDDEAEEEAEDGDKDDANEQDGDDGRTEDGFEQGEDTEVAEKEVVQPAASTTSKGKLHILDFNPYNIRTAWQSLRRPGPFPGEDITLAIVGRMSSLDDTPRVNDDGTSWEFAENVCADHGVFGVPLIGRLPYTSLVMNKTYGFDAATVCEHSIVGYKLAEGTKNIENLTFIYFG